MMMGNLLEKILLTLFLILGLNIYSLSHAEETISSHENCPIKDSVSLRLEGTTRNGEVMGIVDNNFVTWGVNMGNIQGYYNNNFMNLRIEEVNYKEYSLTGWIGAYYIRWRSFGGYFNERINCR